MKKNNFDLLGEDPFWYKDAIIYELPIKSFNDSNCDGFGDFKGLSQKLDYLEDLGVTAIWLLPFYPSPNKDGGYDISDYNNVSSEYGSLRDFKEFLKQAHIRGMRVIIELVINHTSDQHAWFKRAVKAPKHSNYRNYYVWSDTADKYKEARIIFKDFETSNWTNNPITKQYYWHRFYSHQPDLNFENQNVQKDIIKTLDFWLSMGVDGLRLDAIPYLFEEEGTNCENLDKTHEFLKKLRTHVDANYKNKMLLAEANQWPDDSSTYFGSGDECHMAFHFPLMPRLFMAVVMENSFPIIDIMEQTPEIDSSCQWATFLRNHDELTLEMVTDEERDFMYRSFADEPRARINLGIRRRLAPLLKNDRRKIELLNILLFSMKGTPVIYYGDEIGMGDNIYLGDRDGVRTPMQWSSDRNSGFSNANPQKLYLPLIIDPEYHHSVVNVENQSQNSNSLLWWMKRLIDIRKRYKSFSRGMLRFINVNNNKILCFIREYNEEKILVTINLSKWSQSIVFDLSEFNLYTPVELFSGNQFPNINENPYVLTFGPYEFYWFKLEKSKLEDSTQKFLPPSLSFNGSWKTLLLRESLKNMISKALLVYFKRFNYLGFLSKDIHDVEIIDFILLENTRNYIFYSKIDFINKDSEFVQIPLSFISEETFDFDVKDEHVVAKANFNGLKGNIINSIYDPMFRDSIINFMLKKKNYNNSKLRFNVQTMSKINVIHSDSNIKEENDSYYVLQYSNDYLLKFYKKIDYDVSNEYEYRKILENSGISISNKLISTFFVNGNNVSSILLKNIDYISNAKEYLNEVLDKYLEYVLSNNFEPTIIDFKSIYDSNIDIKDVFSSLEIHNFSLIINKLHEFHNCLKNNDTCFNFMYQRSVYQSFISLTKKMYVIINSNINKYDDNVVFDIHELNNKKNYLLSLPSFLLREKFCILKSKIHGDLKFDRILFTGKDFFIKDFDGNLTKPISQRKIEKDFAYDLGSLCASVVFNSYEKLFFNTKIRELDIEQLKPWVEKWFTSMISVFINNYLIKNDDFIENKNLLVKLIHLYIVEKIIERLIEYSDKDSKYFDLSLKCLLNIII